MNASKDQNFTNSLTAVLSTNGSTVISLKAVPSTKALMVTDGNSGTDNGPQNALKDGNDVPTMLAVSSVDGVTPVVLYADINGSLLVDSN